MHNQYNIPIARHKRLLSEKIPTNLIHTYKYKDSTKKTTHIVTVGNWEKNECITISVNYQNLIM